MILLSFLEGVQLLVLCVYIWGGGVCLYIIDPLTPKAIFL